MRFLTSDQYKISKFFKDMQRYIEVVHNSFEKVYDPMERTSVRFFEWFKAYRMIYQIKLTPEEAMIKLKPNKPKPSGMIE